MASAISISRRRCLACKSATIKRRARSPNKSLQGSGTHKVPGRGRSDGGLEQVVRARVLRLWRTAPELSR